ncbi:hypothetical protein DITRI_Ditri20bG0038400 [Diplodiscus trichospermus]
MRSRNVYGSVSGGERRVEFQKTYKGHHPQQSSLDWRTNLFTIFIVNLSRRVPKRALWETFSEYGKVVDIYISSSFKSNRDRDTTFAFVRYKFRSEMVKAILNGNNRRIEGWCIRVKEATYGWNERRLRKADQIQDKGKNKAMTTEYGGGSRSMSDYRSYSDIVKGKGDRGVTQSKEFEMEIPPNDMKWLQRSAIGHVRDYSEVEKMFKSLVAAGINCQLCPMGGVTVLLIFETKEAMENSIRESKMVLDEWIEDLAPWRNSSRQRKLAIWIMLEDVVTPRESGSTDQSQTGSVRRADGSCHTRMD